MEGRSPESGFEGERGIPDDSDSLDKVWSNGSGGNGAFKFATGVSWIH